MIIPLDDSKLGSFSGAVIEGYRANAEAWGTPVSFADEGDVARLEFLKNDTELRTVVARLSEILLPALQEADRQVEQLLRAASKIIALKVGDRWNPVWAEAGYGNESTRIPDRLEERISLAQELKVFFTKRSEWQNPALQLTEETLTAGIDAIQVALRNVKAEEAVKAKLAQECERSAKRLRTRLRALVNEVKHVLAADDPRWAELGMTSPASRRSSKDSRERKAQLKAQARAERAAVNARKLAEAAKAASERARVRSDAAQVAADKLKDAARKLAEKADGLFRKADQLDEKAKEGAMALEAVLRSEADPSGRNTPVSEPIAVKFTESSSLAS